MDAQILKVAREKRGVTQEDLAELAGCSDRQVRRWESGDSEITYNRLRSLCIYTLGLEWLELLREVEGDNSKANSASA
ncbi:helix-turn-helix domain-containing protein [Ferrimonas aestuarii]|uniref:Helix-turn-helix transcriptional regulator n=1 Tax=Ferrimonas aestuarii TaxID=2569539 RepID=A0A4U1BNF0_9GAMM|nr:helix-turn-helix transcriptional regulator [Ferrimonas aestuarii]